MNTGTIATERAADTSFERLIVLEPIPSPPDESWEPYEAELKAIFGFEPDSDPHPSEWFAPDELDEFRPYFETVRRAHRARSRAEEALRRRRVMARDIGGRDRATKDHVTASRERDAADAQQRRLDRAGFGEMRLRVADRLAMRRQGHDLPADVGIG
jgi:hypothetical protein